MYADQLPPSGPPPLAMAAWSIPDDPATRDVTISFDQILYEAIDRAGRGDISVVVSWARWPLFRHVLMFVSKAVTDVHSGVDIIVEGRARHVFDRGTEIRIQDDGSIVFGTTKDADESRLDCGEWWCWVDPTPEQVAVLTRLSSRDRPAIATIQVF